MEYALDQKPVYHVGYLCGSIGKDLRYSRKQENAEVALSLSFCQSNLERRVLCTPVISVS